MKIWIMSDLHTEFRKFVLPYPVPAADVCVVAGDIADQSPAKGLQILADTIAAHMPVVAVAGNHDFYRGSFLEGRREAKAASNPNVFFLDDDWVDIEGVRFVGSSLWTDMDLRGTQKISMHDARSTMNDYKRIKYSKKPFERFKPWRSVKAHLESRSFLQRTLGLPGKTVVVTHHAPSARSLPDEVLLDEASPAYASNLDDLILQDGPAVWIHGHVHHSCDYMIGATRVICNPLGYPGEFTGFDPQLMIDV